ncbi:MAG: UvrD-helicase domain-containing protein [Bacteroidales bacterium]|nr:UvrD-helicase domain-containing protein [Bacteroidales bacterium]
MERQFDVWQQEAIEIQGGRHLVLAPPGCGKTDILTERIVHAHEAGVEYKDMLCLTFTNRAAKGMAQRIADRTGNPVPDDLFVGNIHRYCSQILFNEGIVNHNSAIIDEGDVENIIQEELCKRLHIESRTTELMRFQHGLKQMVMGMRGDLVLHNEMFRAGNLSKLCDVLGRPFDEDSLADIYTHIENLCERYSVLAEMPAANMMQLARAYERYKEENDLLDYDDLLILAYQYLKELESKETKRYNWIEIDEVQDLNALQFALVDLFATPDATIVYLGDEQQAIFSFIGAKLETLETLKHRCEGNIHYLHTNYRSPKYLLDLQNDYAVRNLGINRDLLPTTPNSESKTSNTQDLCLLDVGDAQMESYYAARFAKRYGEMNLEGKVAILVSTNREADDIGEVMNDMGISHFKISGTDLFSLPAMRLLTAHLSVLADEMVFIAWARLLWGLKVTPTYTAARDLIRDMRRVALLPTDFLLYPDSSYLQDFIHVYDTEELVIFDTETTGLDVYHDDIIQIAAVRVRQGKVVGKPFNIILETDKELPETVGGHPNPMLEVYRNSKRHPRAEGLKKFLDYCKENVLVGHNVEFDYQILLHNLLREGVPCTPQHSPALPTKYFDTLKYIRLVRPRLRQYKLGHLLEVLHLEGQNSHQADDDIMATLSLLNFCHNAARQLIADQRLFISDHKKQVDLFREKYSPLYLNPDPSQGIVAELKRAYLQLLSAKLIDPIDKWHHLLHYLDSDLIRTDLYPTLRQQLERYVTDLNTSKEADMCGGSLEERYIISTVHKSKGLEFDTVIIYRAIDGSYPGAHSWTEKQIQEDARRLFVALSRSKRRLCILYDDYYGRSTHALSPFLEKVKNHFTLYRRGSDGKIREV